MERCYMQEGNSYRPIDKDQLNLADSLPIATYTVGVSPAGYYLKCIDDLEISGRIYGDVEKTAERILTTYNSRPASTGVLLSGQKGTGKTMLTKCISEMGRRRDIITIVINNAYHGDAFNAFLQSIEQPAIVLFDEFEKVYDREQQSQLLTIFDGVFASKKLFLLTCNDKYRIDEYMHNRPGRIYYALEYEGLGDEFVRAYCADNLHDLTRVDGILTASKFFSSFSFDMLKALVEEMNRYNESATEAMKMLNMKPTGDVGAHYSVSVRMRKSGRELVFANQSHDTIKGSPFMLSNAVEFSFYVGGGDDDEPSCEALSEVVPLGLKKEGLDPRLDSERIKAKEDFDIPFNSGNFIGVDRATSALLFSVPDYPDLMLAFTPVRRRHHSFDYDGVAVF